MVPFELKFHLVAKQLHWKYFGIVGIGSRAASALAVWCSFIEDKCGSSQRFVCTYTMMCWFGIDRNRTSLLLLTITKRTTYKTKTVDHVYFFVKYILFFLLLSCDWNKMSVLTQSIMRVITFIVHSAQFTRSLQLDLQYIWIDLIGCCKFLICTNILAP